MKSLFKKIFVSIFFFSLFFAGHLAHAQDTTDNQNLFGGEKQKTFLETALGQGTNDPRVIIANVLRILLGFIGIILVCLMLYAGYLWMYSDGDPTKIEKSKGVIKSATIGLLIIISAFAIVSFILSSLLGIAGLAGDGGGGGLPGGGGGYDGYGSFKIVSTYPENDEFEVFRNTRVQVFLNREIGHNLSTSTIKTQFTFKKIKQYTNIDSYLHIVATSGLEKFVTDPVTGAKVINPATGEPATTTAPMTPSTTMDNPIDFTVATSSWQSVDLLASTICDYKDITGASTTIKNCLDAWAQYEFTAQGTDSGALISVNGETLDCTKGCRYVFTTNDSIDIGKPVITGISPIGGFCRMGKEINASSTDTPCLENKDCFGAATAPKTESNPLGWEFPSYRCDMVTPNAAKLNFVTISGRHFGTAEGDLYFSNKINDNTLWSRAALANSASGNPLCTTSWKDQEIIAILPNTTYDRSLTIARVVASTSGNNLSEEFRTDISNDKYGPRVREMIVNGINRPGLCQIDPNFGEAGTSTVYHGINLMDAGFDTSAFFGMIQSRATSSSVFADPTNNQGFVPSLAAATTTTFALRGKIFSNNLYFRINDITYGGPMITSFEKTSGKKGQYVTVTGRGFGYASMQELLSDGTTTKKLLFVADNNAGDIADPIVLQGLRRSGDAFAGDFKFPEICADSLWTDKEITVKVPDIPTANYGTKYWIYVIVSKPGTTTAAWITSSFYISTPDTKIPHKFSYSNIALSPGICKLQPIIGTFGDVVNAYGEYFPPKAITPRNFIFQKDKIATSTFDLVFPVTKGIQPDYATTNVPKGAVTGQVYIMAGSGATLSTSTPKNFTIGRCKIDTDCAPNGVYCCGSGDKAECRPGASAGEACSYGGYTSVFEWDFTTALATSSLRCSGYVNANSCLLANSCPNAPGECRSSDAQKEVGACGDDYCKKSLPQVCDTKLTNIGYSSCFYDNTKNACVASTTGVSTTKVTCRTSSEVLIGKEKKKMTCNQVLPGQVRWQYNPGKNICASGYYMDYNGQCTQKDSLGQPASCGDCKAGFNCEEIAGVGRCVSSQKVCGRNATCQNNKCVENFSCDCCCKVSTPAEPDLSERTCCTGTICKAKLCADNTPDYGLCSQCARNAAGTATGVIGADQTESDKACNCKAGGSGAARFCNLDARVYINGEWHENKDGICMDAAQLGEPCKASTTTQFNGSATTPGSYATTSAKQTSSYWQYTASPATPCLNGTFLDIGNVCKAKSLPNIAMATCTTPFATTSKLKSGFIATCTPIVGSINYWTIGGQIPCPAGTYLNANGTCTVVPRLPYTCQKEGATTTIKKLFSSSTMDTQELTCVSTTHDFIPGIIFGATTSTTILFFSKNVQAVIGYKQVATPMPGTYLDYNGWYSIGGKPEECPVGVADGSILYNDYYHATTTCYQTQADGTGQTKKYWQMPKYGETSLSSCQDGTYMSPTNSGAVHASSSWPWCTLGQGPVVCSTEGATSTVEINGATTTATCHLFQYNISPVSGIGSCSADAKQCDTTNGLFCDARSCTCNKIATISTTSTVRAGEQCLVPNVCTTGVASCDTANTNLSCRTNPGEACRCCCDAGYYDPSQKKNVDMASTTVKDSRGNDIRLVCEPNITPCTSTSTLDVGTGKYKRERGLFCGCTEDIQCNFGEDGCGVDTCCRSRIFGSSTYPYNYAQNICRNTVVSLTFTGPIDQTSVSKNMMLVGDYGTNPCPNDTSYFTTIHSIERNWFERLFAWFRRTIGFDRGDTLYAVDYNYCAVQGTASMGSNNNTIKFSPKSLLDPARTYIAIVLGDASTTDIAKEGVLSDLGIAFHDANNPDNGNVVTMNSAYASSSITLNGRQHFGYVWRFTTKTLASDNQGVCLLDKLKVNPRAMTGGTYLFKTIKDNVSDNDPAQPASFDTINTDSDKVFVATSYDKSGHEIAPTTEYAWDMKGWNIDDTKVAEITSGFPFVYPNKDYYAYVKAKSIQDAQSYLNAKVLIATSTFSDKGKTLSGRSLIRTIICDNLWPTMTDPSTWNPWVDSANNCSSNASGCSVGNNFSFYYCRDAGSAGSFDDLPALVTATSGTPRVTIVGKNSGFCSIAKTKSCDGDNPSSCVAGEGYCKAVMKEFFFFRDEDLFNSSDAGFSITPFADGTGATSTRTSGILYRGKIYYGLQSGNYTDWVDFPANSSSVTISNLIPGKTYYFTMTTINASGQEGSKSVERIVTMKDTKPPIGTISLINASTTVSTSTVTLGWSVLSDAVRYRVYFGLLANGYMSKMFDIGNRTTFTVPNLVDSKLYMFVVSAFDKSGNETATSTAPLPKSYYTATTTLAN